MRRQREAARRVERVERRAAKEKIRPIMGAGRWNFVEKKYVIHDLGSLV